MKRNLHKTTKHQPADTIRRLERLIEAAQQRHDAAMDEIAELRAQHKLLRQPHDAEAPSY